VPCASTGSILGQVVQRRPNYDNLVRIHQMAIAIAAKMVTGLRGYNLLPMMPVILITRLPNVLYSPATQWMTLKWMRPFGPSQRWQKRRMPLVLTGKQGLDGCQIKPILDSPDTRQPWPLERSQEISRSRLRNSETRTRPLITTSRLTRIPKTR